MKIHNHNFRLKIERIWFRLTSSLPWLIHGIFNIQSVGQPAWQVSSKVKSQSRDFRFIFEEKWRSILRLKYVGLQ